MSVAIKPSFPDFKPIQLEDRDIFRDIFSQYKPETSEWTFTNLFIWRSHYGFRWSIYKDWLLVLCEEIPNSFYAMQPIGPPSRREVTNMLLGWLREEKGEAASFIEKGDKRLILELDGANNLYIEPTRDNFDYVYRREDLVRLAGNKYRSKRNHINKLLRSHLFTYASLNEEHIDACLKLQEKWCKMRRCNEDLNLMGEWEAIREILANYHALKVTGGVIMIEGRVEAFTIGELLNDQTAVVHIEKANPEVPGLYPIINQQCCDKCWRDVSYVNREQDLGIPGLREAKLSYYPDHFVEKYRITMRVL